MSITDDATIHRENFADTLDRLLTKSDIVLVRGEPGVGKTEFLRQISLRRDGPCIELFVRPLSRVAYDPDLVLSDLYEQAIDAIGPQRKSQDDPIDLAALRNAWIGLQRRARRQRRTVTFIVDGIDDIPAEDDGLKGVLLEFLPFGCPNFKFVISGNQLALPRPALKPAELLLVPFTRDETARFLAPLVSDDGQVDEIHRACRGIPDHLASVRRVLESGISPDSLISSFSLKVPNLFALEWRAVPSDDEALANALSILAFDRNEHPISVLARVVGLDAATLESRLARIAFISIRDSRPTFKSSTLRLFAQDKLRSRRRHAAELILDDLLRAPDSPQAIELIPAYYQDLEQPEALLTYLSVDHFSSLLDKSHSFIALTRRSLVGLEAASRLNRDGEMSRFSLQLATGASIACSSMGRTEIEARMALNDVESAKRIAQGAMLKESRLQLLATVAKMMREANTTPEQELLEEIDQLYNEIDVRSLGEAAVPLAADLVYFKPELSVRLLEESSSLQTADDQRVRWLTATIAAASAASAGASPALLHEMSAAFHTGIKEAKLNDWTTAAWVLYAKYSAAEMIAEAAKVTRPRFRVELLRLWLSGNARSVDAHEVLQYTIDAILGATEITPAASLLVDLASAIPYIEDVTVRRRFVMFFDSHRLAAEELGPTADYVRLCLRLARGEMTYDPEGSRQRIRDAFVYVRGQSDVALRSLCLGRLYAALPILDPDGILETSERLHHDVKAELKTAIDHTLSHSAEHIDATKELIDVLSPRRLDDALQLAASLNTQHRRDEAAYIAVRAVCNNAPSSDALDTAIAAARGIECDEHRDSAFLAVIHVLAGAGRYKNAADLGAAATSALSLKFTNPKNKIRALSVVYRFLREVKAPPERAEGLLEGLRTDLSKLDSGWDRVEMGFELARKLAACDPPVAFEVLKWADEERRAAGISPDVNEMTVSYSLSLVIRAHKGLLLKRADRPDDLDILASVIEHLPSLGKQIRYWCDVALNLALAKRTDEAAQIIGARIAALSRALEKVDRDAACEAVSDGMAAIYLTHKALADEWFNGMSLEQKDRAANNVFKALMRRRSPDEPFEGWWQWEREIRYEEALTIVDVIRRMEADRTLWASISVFVNSVASRKNRSFITREQIGDISRKLGEVVDTKLPDPKRITHEGYKILAEALILWMQGMSLDAWRKLCARARVIPNQSDCVFVLAELIETPPKDGTDDVKAVLAEAVERARGIVGIRERCGRLRMIARAANKVSERALAKDVIRMAMASTVSLSDGDAAGVRKEIVNEACKIDREYARTLVDASDGDPARRRAKAEIAEEIAVLDRKDERRGAGELSPSGRCDRELSGQAWEFLGALNADRIPPPSRERIREWLLLASKASLEDGYPLFAFAIEAAVRRYAETREVGTVLRPLFDSMALAMQLTMRISMKASNWSPRVRMAETAGNGIVVREGEREGGVRFLREWLESTEGDVLTICDPYFAPEELKVLAMVREADPGCRVRILTSRRAQEEAKVAEPLERAYWQQWQKMADGEPPETEIMIAGVVPGGQSPIHDRWWLKGQAGIRVGTSFNGLGVGRVSEISTLAPQDVTARSAEVERCWGRLRSLPDGRRISYRLFGLMEEG
jgi:NACHT domain